MEDTPTIAIDCCQVNAYGQTCGVPDPTHYDIFGGANTIQTCALILSNLPLLIAATKAAYMGLYDISMATFISMCFSWLYHMCKAQIGGANVCVLPFCSLKHLDYASSTTVLMRILLHVIIPVPYYTADDLTEGSKSSNSFMIIFGKHVKRAEKAFTICLYFMTLIILQSTSFCGGTQNAGLFGLLIGITALFTLVVYWTLWISVQGNWSIWMNIWHNAGYNGVNTIVGLSLGLIALILFFIEDGTAISSYWYIHTLWHIFAELSEIVLMDVRTKRRGIHWFMFCKRYSGVEG